MASLLNFYYQVKNNRSYIFIDLFILADNLPNNIPTRFPKNPLQRAAGRRACAEDAALAAHSDRIHATLSRIRAILAARFRD